MGKVFTLISQLRNLTNRLVRFEVSYDGYCPLPDLPPGKTGEVKLYRILRCLRERGSDWKIRVLVDDEFIGIEFNPLILLDCARITFRHGAGSDSGVLFLHGVRENSSDFWLRLKYFGFMRNIFWNGRKSFLIARSDSRFATKLRNLEAPGQKLATSFVDKTLLKSSSIHETQSSPPTISKAHNHEQKIEKSDRPSAAPEKPRILPAPLPPTPPPSRSRKQYYNVAEDSSDEEEDSWRDITDHDSSSDTTDHVSVIRRPREVVRRDIGYDGGVRRSVRREQITVSHDDTEHVDSFEYVFLFCFAFALVWFVTKLYFNVLFPVGINVQR